MALKMILSGAHADEKDLKRFQREAEAVAQLQHSNIVQIHDVGEHAGQPFLSPEFVKGGGLDEKISGEPQPPAERSLPRRSARRSWRCSQGARVSQPEASCTRGAPPVAQKPNRPPPRLAGCP